MKIILRFSLALTFVLSIQGLFSQIHNESINPTGDAAVFSGSVGINYGTATTAIISSTGLTHYRFLSKFDIAGLGIPPNAVITSAELLLTPAGIGEGTVASTDLVLQTITASWIESGAGGVTYANQPATNTTNQVTTSSLVSGKRKFNVTTLVQNIVNGTTTNYGWRIRRNPENVSSSQSTYGTLDNGTSTNRPELKITWYEPMKITGATIVHCTNTGILDGSITPTLDKGSSSFVYKWTNSSGTTVGTSSTLTGCAYGWYGLKVTGAYGEAFYYSFLVGAYCEPVSITYNPDKNFVDDAVISDLTPTINAGSSLDFIGNKFQDHALWYSQKSLIKFKLWMDPNLTVSKADLLLSGKAHVYTSRSNAAQLDKITQSWIETGVTWNNAPTTSTSIQTTIPATTSTTENDTLDIIAFWNAWKSSNTTNYGMMLQLQSYLTPAAAISYHSSDGTTPSLLPKINFTVDLTNATGCQPTAIGDISYSQLKYQLDGGYATTFSGKLKIAFKEESGIAASKYIPYEVKDKDNVVIAGSNISGTTFGGAVAIPYTVDENNHIVDLSGITGITTNTYYTIEVITANGTRKKLRFHYIN